MVQVVGEDRTLSPIEIRQANRERAKATNPKGAFGLIMGDAIQPPEFRKSFTDVPAP
jgi:hypothetical protein